MLSYQRLCATDLVICLEEEGAAAFEEGGGEGRGETSRIRRRKCQV